MDDWANMITLIRRAVESFKTAEALASGEMPKPYQYSKIVGVVESRGGK